jgi:hypothetical protein
MPPDFPIKTKAGKTLLKIGALWDLMPLSL